jgi:hypothetical protein
MSFAVAGDGAALYTDLPMLRVKVNGEKSEVNT